MRINIRAIYQQVVARLNLDTSKYGAWINPVTKRVYQVNKNQDHLSVAVKILHQKDDYQTPYISMFKEYTAMFKEGYVRVAYEDKNALSLEGKASDIILLLDTLGTQVDQFDVIYLTARVNKRLYDKRIDTPNPIGLRKAKEWLKGKI